jgi:hypothetical protein
MMGFLHHAAAGGDGKIFKKLSLPNVEKLA